VLDVSGLATLDGTVDFSALSGFTPAAGDDFTFLLFGSLSGKFATIDFSNWTCPTGDGCDVVYGANSVTFDIDGPNPSEGSGGGVTSTPEPGSFALLGTALLALAGAACRQERRRAI
jgi:hypothetical protein